MQLKHCIMKKIITTACMLSLILLLNSTKNFANKVSSAPTGGLLVTGIQSNAPFIGAGTNVNTAISYGSGILQVPAYSGSTIIFGTKAANTAGWAADGTNASFSTANSAKEYVQFVVKPSSGYNLNITGFTITGNGSSASGANYYAVTYSVNDTTVFGSGNSVFLDSAGSTGNFAYVNNSALASNAYSSGQNIFVGNNTTLYIRVYLWRKNTATSSSQFSINNFTVSGTASSIASATSSITNIKLCYGNSYTFNGVTYNNTGTYTAHLTNSVGADSSAILNLIISNPPITNTSNLTGCSVIYKGITYNGNTVVRDTVRNYFGCDSIYTVANITIICPTINSFLPSTAATGSSVTINGAYFTGATAVSFGGVAAASFTVVNDNTITCIVGSGNSGNVSVTTANGTGTVGGFTYNNGTTGLLVTGIQSGYPLLTAGTNVNITTNYGSGVLQTPVYSNGTILFGTKVAGAGGWAADGTYATYNTAYNKNEYVQFVISPTPGNDITINGFTIKGNKTSSSDNNYYAVAYTTDTTQFGNGTCVFIDSAGSAGNVCYENSNYLASNLYSYGQNIAVNNRTKLYVRIYLWRKNSATSSSQFTLTNFTVSGTTTSLANSSVTNAHICAGSSYAFGGNSYTTTGTYIVHLTNAAGADSAATLNLSVSAAAVTNNISLSGCGTVVYKGNSYNTSTVVSDVLKGYWGCDSIVTVANITVNNVPVMNAIVGSNSICLNSNSILTNSKSGGIWSSSDNNIVDVDDYGKIGGLNVGNATISYAVTNGCGTTTNTIIITVNDLPTVKVDGVNSINIGSSSTLSGIPTGGIWKSSDTSIATVDINGTVSTLSSGLVGIFYTIQDDNTSCINTGAANIYINGSSGYKSLANNNQTSKINICAVNQMSINILKGLYNGIVNKHFYGLGSFSTYYVKQNTTAKFVDAECLIGNDVTIIVETGATLIISGSHFYGCNTWWNGINVQPGGTLIVNRSASHSSFIEDAVTAIHFDIQNNNSLVPKTFYGCFLSVDNTIFNRNNISIEIENYNPANYTIYPFYVKNCIFTCRDIFFQYGHEVWDDVYTLKNFGTNVLSNTNYPLTPDGLSSPYIYENRFSSTSTWAFLQLPQSSAKPYAGIYLNNVGYTNGNNLPGIQIGYSFTDYNPTVTYIRPIEVNNAILGNTPSTTPINYTYNTSVNVFDNIFQSIQAINSNLTSVNNTFQIPKSYLINNPQTTGIGSSCYSNFVNNRINVITIIQSVFF